MVGSSSELDEASCVIREREKGEGRGERREWDEERGGVSRVEAGKDRKGK